MRVNVLTVLKLTKINHYIEVCGSYFGLYIFFKLFIFVWVFKY